MAKYVLYDIANAVFHNYYEATEKRVYGGDWGDGSKHVHAEIPDGIDYRKCDLVSVPLGDGQTEDDIIFDYKHSYSTMIGTVVTYYKFEVNATKEAAVDAEDAAAALKAAKDAKALKGKILNDLAVRIYNIISGHAYDDNLTAVQIATLKSTYPEAFQALSEGQPITAKTYIDSITPDGIITQDVLDHVALEYTEFYANYPSL